MTTWSLGRARQVAERPRVVVVVGPGLRHAASEARAIAATWGPLATVLEGGRATTKAVLEAFANADIVHVAAHGTFRGDNPLVSSVRLTDGGLTGYELERAAASCTLVVLSSCDTGSADTAGDGSFGLAGLLIDSGVRSVVASVTPVGDKRTSRLMGHFHELLRAGSSPAAALAGARARSGAGRAPDGFVVFGE